MRARLFILAAALTLAAGGAVPMFLSPAASAQSSSPSAFVFFTDGILGANGQYSQITGTFFKVVEGTPTPTPSPTATPTPEPCEPFPGAPGGIFYMGPYTLSNGETGIFLVRVPDGGNSTSGIGAPEDFPENPEVVEDGPVTITLQIDQEAGTGTGTISFTSGGTAITGTITIDFKFPYDPTPPVTCETPTPTPTPSPTPTPTPTPTPSPSPSPPSTIELSGRVLTPAGRGLSGATVSLLGPGDQVRRVSTSSLGFYSFQGVSPGTYRLSANSKRFRFSNIDITAMESRSNVDFFGLE